MARFLLNNLSRPPVYDGMTTKDGVPSLRWNSWLTELHKQVTPFSSLPNDNILINPDFHWSRVSGNTPITTDGAIVEEWYIRKNGMTFTGTPTFYTSTVDSSNTGSHRFLNLDITAINSNAFEIYQTLTDSISLLQNQTVSMSALIKNKTSSVIKCAFYIGFDTNNSGTDDVSIVGSTFSFGAETHYLSSTLVCPAINTDNQANTENIKLLIYAAAPVDFDVFFVKLEVGTRTTPLFVQHALEKIKIDNK